MRRLVGVIALALAGAAIWASPAISRQMQMMDSFPRADATISGDHAAYFVRFDGPVDHRNSHLWITSGNDVLRSLTPRLDSAPNVLFAEGATPQSGNYALHWEVRSMPDGEITVGAVNFHVTR